MTYSAIVQHGSFFTPPVENYTDGMHMDEMGDRAFEIPVRDEDSIIDEIADEEDVMHVARIYYRTIIQGVGLRNVRQMDVVFNQKNLQLLKPILHPEFPIPNSFQGAVRAAGLPKTFFEVMDICTNSGCNKVFTTPVPKNGPRPKCVNWV